jgi:hypothetical protein
MAMIITPALYNNHLKPGKRVLMSFNQVIPYTSEEVYISLLDL